jgi:predicted PurR-regulated permease PerM
MSPDERANPAARLIREAGITPRKWLLGAVTGLLIVAFFFLVYVAKTLLLPVVLALVLHLILKPIQRFLLRLRINRVVTAAVILLGLIGLIAASVLYLREPLVVWMEDTPQHLRDAEHKLRDLLRPMESVSAVADQVADLTDGDDAGRPPRVEVSGPGMRDAVLGYARQFLITLSVTLILLFFLLGYGQILYEKLLAEFGAFAMTSEVGALVSSYLLTITVINIVLGMCVMLAMYLLGMPNALLWGIMAALLNFVPYLGALVGVSLILVVSLVTFDQPGQILVVPFVYFLITSVEGNLVTPMILGRRFTVNPIILFAWLILWGWLWGVAGALIAVPSLMAFRIVCEHTPALRSVSRIMSQ